MDKKAAFELGKMRSLIERMEGKFTPHQAMLNEERLIIEAVKEISNKPVELIDSSDKMFEFLDSLVKFNPKDPNRALNNKHARISMGYVSDVKLNTTVKRRNPLTNRPKTYNDYSVIGNNIAGIVCVTNYTYDYTHRSHVKYDYSTRFIPQRNALRVKYDIPLPKQKPGYNGNGSPTGEPTAPRPKDQGLADKFGGDYNPQNLFKVISKTMDYYPIDFNGNVLRDGSGKPVCLGENEIGRFLAEEDPVDGVKVLQKLGKEKSVIDQYANEFNGLNMKYKNFKADSILYIRGMDRNTGTRKLFLNKEINRLVDDIQINPRDMYQIAYARYRYPIKKGEEENENETV